MADVNPIPEGYPQLSPYLVIDGAANAIDFYREVFGATERMRMPGDTPERIGHAELEIGSALLMLSDEYPDMGHQNPKRLGGTPVMLSVYVDDVDAVFAKALQAGATELRPLADQFYGDRSGQFEDPFGHRWSVASHIEDVSEEEMMRRAAEAAQG